MDKKDIINALINHYSNGNKAQFAAKIGVTPQTISSWLSRNTFDIDRIYANCECVSAKWLLSGVGDITEIKKEAEEKIKAIQTNDNYYKNPIPLVIEKVAAGFGGSDFCIQETDVKDYYVIPKFRHFNVDFMIEVSGDSMIPYFYPGDIIACSILHDRNFIQWNRVHVIATREQGLLVKRIMPGDSADNYTAVSDNKDYPPFKIPLCDITGVALVVGSVSLE